MKGSLVILLKTNVEEMAVYRYPTMSMKIQDLFFIATICMKRNRLSSNLPSKTGNGEGVKDGSSFAPPVASTNLRRAGRAQFSIPSLPVGGLTTTHLRTITVEVCVDRRHPQAAGRTSGRED